MKNNQYSMLIKEHLLSTYLYSQLVYVSLAPFTSTISIYIDIIVSIDILTIIVVTTAIFIIAIGLDISVFITVVIGNKLKRRYIKY